MSRELLKLSKEDLVKLVEELQTEVDQSFYQRIAELETENQRLRNELDKYLSKGQVGYRGTKNPYVK